MSLKIQLSIFEWGSLGASMNLEINLTPYMIFGLVVVRYMRLPTSLLYKVGSIDGHLSTLLKVVPIAIGLSTSFLLSILDLFKISNSILLLTIKNSL